ncbi:mediator complex, subunit Med11 [Xylariaceae sp. FL0804]|nr:mediator complex, subunit Med11 [Xylariaceae sp. FL0804]
MDQPGMMDQLDPMDQSGEETAFVPFTKAERIQQLADIDKRIVSLLRSTAQAVQTLGKREPGAHDAATATNQDPLHIFNDSMDDFLKTLRAVNVGMKRQIWGLEEARIISLSKNETPVIKEAGGEVKASVSQNGHLELDGHGRIGGLDVGWLNSRSNKVERDMESDLWDSAEDALVKILQHHNQEPNRHFDQTQQQTR